MADLNYVVSVLNATILSTKSSVTLEQCNRDYKELEGEWIPYKKLGFRTLEDFFENLPGFRLARLSNGCCIIEAKKSSEIKHITDMVSRQKTTKSKGSKYHLQRPARNIKSGTSWKPGPSWGYNKSPHKISPVYNKPKVHSNTSSKHISNQQSAINRDKPSKVIPTQSQSHKTPVLTNSNTVSSPTHKAPISSNTSQAPAPAPVSQSLTQVILCNKAVKSTTIPTSKLSGIKPGDILAKSQSNSSSGTGGSKETPASVKPAVNNAKTSAASRLTALQNTLQVADSESITCIHKSKDVEEVIPESEPCTMIRQDSLDSLLKDLPNNKSRLLKCCEVMNLPQPVFKTVPIKHKRGNLYDCTVKIGNTYSFTTYPNSQASEEQAIETASLSGVGELKQVIAQESYPVSDIKLAISRISEIVSLHPCGVWANTLPNIYKEEYKEYLPKNWLQLVNKCPNISQETGMKDMVMLLPVSESCTPSPQSGISDISKHSAGPPALQFPDESLWNVFVMSAFSTVEIWLRIIGEEYSDAFETLVTDMEMYYLENTEPSSEIVEGGWYALNSDNCWLRVRILEIDIQNRTALCFLVDNGDEETYPFKAFYDLPHQFLCVPPQAILCRLAGLEEYALIGEVDNDKTFLSDALTGKVLVAEVLETPDEKQDDPSITLVLFDTSTEVDVNINKELLRKLSDKATSPRLPQGVSEVYVMDVTTSGKVFVQIHNDSWKLLQNMLHQIACGPFPIESLQASFGEIVPSPRIHYLVKSLCGEWRRGVLRSGVTEDQLGVKCVSVRYIDCGRTESVPVKDLLMLERISDALNHFPAQALCLTLHNVGTLNSEQMDKINSLVARNTPVLCKQVAPGSTIVELFVRTQPHNVLCSVNNALILEKELCDKLKSDDISSLDPLTALTKKKQRLFAYKNSPVARNPVSIKSDKPFNIVPEIGTYFDVLVCMASNPRNFVVQPLQHLQELSDLMTNMQDVCKKLPQQNIVLTKSKMYAVFHDKDKQWYRASFLGMVLKDTPSMYFIDYGDYYSTTIDSLQELPQEFTVLPPMAMKAKLYGVRPKDQDWSVEDCVRFIELVNEQSFASVVKNIEEDPMNKNESILVLDLIDTSTPEDLYVNALLVKERRAVPLQ